MKAYYNEFDPFAAEWLRNLIWMGLVADGDVDERSITEVTTGDIEGYTQCHFFAGIGGWSLALRLAGWPDARPVWTGSCPCQPFSAAGRQKGDKDERHLWPEFFRLIAECRPAAIFGEQVASRLGREWLAGVFADLESVGYAAAGADLCAAGIGAPHIRQRLWWVADAEAEGWQRDGRLGARSDDEQPRPAQAERGERGAELEGLCIADGGLADAERSVGDRGADEPEREAQGRAADRGAGSDGWLGDAEQSRLEGHAGDESDRDEPGRHDQDANGSTASAGGDSWSNCIWLPCADGKARRIEPGIAPLAHGIPARVGKLRGYGNAIVPQVAQAFIEAVESCRP